MSLFIHVNPASLNNFWLFLSTFEHKYLNFLLVPFSKQTRYFSLNAFVFLAELRTLYQPKMSLFDILGTRLNNQLIFWCVQEQLRQIPLILPLVNSLCITLNGTWGSVSFAQKWQLKMSFGEKLYTLILWVHFRTCTLLLWLDYRSWVSTSTLTRILFYTSICTPT